MHVDSVNDTILGLGLHSTVVSIVHETKIRIGLAQTAKIGQIVVVVCFCRVVWSQPVENDKLDKRV